MARPRRLLRAHALRAALSERIAPHHRRQSDRRPPTPRRRHGSLDVPGLYLAGGVTGLPLIKNAILQGARAAERIAAEPRRGAQRPTIARGGGALDLVIVGAGPAGISAALRAGELGLSFEVIEQGSVAQSIRSFPRGKLVFDQPLELPVTGKLWLRESTKEELLSHWLRIVRQARLPIREDTRMTGIAAGDGGLPRHGRAARGRRALRDPGAPRAARHRSARIAAPPAASRSRPSVEARVHYHLADARSFEGDARDRGRARRRGDRMPPSRSSRQPGTRVTLVHRGAGGSRGKARNIAEVKRLVEAGRVRLHLRTGMGAIAADRVTLRGPDGEASIGWDAALVMIGSVPPREVLRAAGVRTIAEG